jgi:KaiC/GvpD/RAD55 family RecA-like ATPase
VVVFARPEVGKTLFVVQLACKAARDGHRVLYLGNEEPLSRTVKRAVSCLTGKTNAEIEPRWEAALAAVRKGGLDNVIFHHLEPGTLAEVERCVRVAKPALVIIDQIRNITAEGDSSTVRMEDVQKAVRSMAAKYSFAAVSVTQAGNTAENKLFLDMADVDSSKTGIPGACDLMIGLGMEEGDKDRPKRGISLPKNKLGHTHEGFVVSFHQHKTQITGDN